jgi:hypothetical protein
LLRAKRDGARGYRLSRYPAAQSTVASTGSRKLC